MKMQNTVGVGLLVFTAFVAHATDRYVSEDGAYGEGLGERYTDLQEAVTAAQNDETVWVTNGFVCASGIGGNKSRIDVPNRRITIRSQAGLVDEAKGLGATIKGPGLSCADADQARCVNFAGTTATLVGFILEDGYPNGYGGAVAGSASLIKNCVVRNSKGTRGGGVSGVICEDCVITNNIATDMGGGVYGSTKLSGCTIAYNRSTGNAYGGGVGTWAPAANTFYTNCWFYGNYSPKFGGGGLCFRGGPGPVIIVDCVISNNTMGVQLAGAGCFSEQRAAKLYDCDIVENVATNSSGAGISGCIATDCRILRNIGISNGTYASNGAGANDSVLTNCVVSFNTNDCLVAGKTYAGGGGASGVTAVNCRFEGNYANHRGGALFGACESYNCTVVSNKAEKGGSGAWGGQHYNGLFVGNDGNGVMDYDGSGNVNSRVVNCTFFGNKSSQGLGFYQVGYAINCVSWGNGPKSGTISSPWDYAYKAVSNCCCAVMPQTMATGDIYGCFVADPKFRTIDGKDYYVGNKDCKNASLPFGWMTDAKDARSKDVYGNPRVLGTAADLGAVESKVYGLSIFVR